MQLLVKISRQHKPVVAKALGALVVVDFSKDLGLPDIDLEGDSLLVVQAIKNSSAQWASYGHIVCNILSPKGLNLLTFFLLTKIHKIY